ncbi:MAG TPA: hypothetical protein VKB19_07785 [Pedobacter sp.]|nr:hypothetical protein [Pedobacter sp.]
MATLNGFIRSANASYKRAARASERHAREAARHQKENLKQQIRANSASAVHLYNNYIDTLLSVHKECSEKLNWNHFANEKEPQPPGLRQEKENAAQFFHRNYKPSFFDKLFGNDKKKQTKLLQGIEIAKVEDRTLYEEELKSYKSDLHDWKKIQSITKGISENDPIAFKNAFDFFDPFSQISELGSRLNCNFFNDNVTIDLYVNSEEVVPDYILSTTATGKLSNKKMPISKFNELYQDYVCSCTLRIAREAFALLPISLVIITAHANLLNTVNGHVESKPILTVKFDPSVLNRLNFKTIDCSDSISNFPHQMKFSKTNGFAPIEPVQTQRNFSSSK